jgi:two-component system chemotaxis response regulator CheY
MGRKILAVDDSATVRTSVKLVLERAGYEVELASDGEEALGKAKSASERFHLLITDLNMPKLDGIGLIKAVRAQPGYRFTPILMLTTESQADKKEEGKKAGATGWIVKPFQPDQLLAVIQRVLRS